MTAPSTVWYFAEGFTGDSWLTFISVGNLTTGPAEVTATYNILGQAPVSRTITVGAGARGTFAGHEVATGVGPGEAFGVTITSDVAVVAQEVLIDPKPGVALAHAVMGAMSLGTEFTFGGGSSEQDWLTFVSATNPGGTEVSVSATYYFEGAFAPITRTVALAANSRTTFSSFDPATGVPSGRRYGVKVTASAPIVSQEVVINVAGFHAHSAVGTPGPTPTFPPAGITTRSAGEAPSGFVFDATYVWITTRRQVRSPRSLRPDVDGPELVTYRRDTPGNITSPPRPSGDSSTTV